MTSVDSLLARLDGYAEPPTPSSPVNRAIFKRRGNFLDPKGTPMAKAVHVPGPAPATTPLAKAVGGTATTDEILGRGIDRIERAIRESMVVNIHEAPFELPPS